jgi:uncharacterized protein YggT (Ycf19 family)
MGFDFSPVVVFLLLGLLKRVLVSVLWSYKAGATSSSLAAPNDYGDPVGAGVYLYQLQAKNFVKTRKMVLLKWNPSGSNKEVKQKNISNIILMVIRRKKKLSRMGNMKD